MSGFHPRHLCENAIGIGIPTYLMKEFYRIFREGGMKYLCHKSKGFRSMCWACMLMLLFCCVTFLHPQDLAAQGTQVERNKVSIRWAFGVLKGSENDQELTSVPRNAVLKTGDRFKMMVQLEDNCFVYVLHHDTHDEVALLFPYDVEQFGINAHTGKRYYIPEGDEWFALDEHTGKETVTLIVSPARLAGLEKLLVDYLSSEEWQKADLKRQILDEISVLRRQNRELAAPAERPVTIGGTIRGYGSSMSGGCPDVASIAEAIQSDGPVVRVFTIDHQ